MTDRLRQQADLLRNRIKELLGARQPAVTVQGETVNDRIRLLETYQRRLEQSLAKLEENQHGIVCYDGKEHGVEQSVQMAIEQNQALIFAAGDRILDVQQEIQGLRQQPANVNQAHVNGQPVVQNGDQEHLAQSDRNWAIYQLSKFNRPKFDGDIATWPAFWSLFRATIHENNGLTNVEKMRSLLGQLEGAALSSVSMAVTEENYTVAMQNLERRFGNRQQIVQTQWFAINTLFTSSEDVKQLRAFYDKVETHLGVLERMGEDTNNALLTTVLMEKLPVPVQVELRLGERIDTRQLRTRLNHYILAKEAAELAKAASQKKPGQRKPVRPNPQVQNFNGTH